MRTVVLTYESRQSCRIIQRLVSERSGDVVAIAYSTTVIPGRGLLSSVVYILRRTAISYFLMRSFEIVVGRLRLLLRAGNSDMTLAEISRSYGIPLIPLKDVNSDKSISTLQSFEPEVIASVYFNQRLEQKVISVPARGCINAHPSLLPSYRGLFPNFWVLANNESVTGVTAHRIENDRFDSGAILAQHQVTIDPHDSVVSLSVKTAYACANTLVEAIEMIETGNELPVSQDASSASYFSWPRSRDMKRLRSHGRHFWTPGRLLEDLGLRRTRAAAPVDDDNNS